MKHTIAGVDLAKEVIQICIYTHKKVHSNKEVTHREFLSWLFTTKPMRLVFEACGTSNDWKQRAIEAGHEAHFISAKRVSTVRQNQKTDKNDALTIVQAHTYLILTLLQAREKNSSSSSQYYVYESLL